jgi:hypothetical protein
MSISAKIRLLGYLQICHTSGLFLRWILQVKLDKRPDEETQALSSRGIIHTLDAIYARHPRGWVAGRLFSGTSRSRPPSAMDDTQTSTWFAFGDKAVQHHIRPGTSRSSLLQRGYGEHIIESVMPSGTARTGSPTDLGSVRKRRDEREVPSSAPEVQKQQSRYESCEFATVICLR